MSAPDRDRRGFHLEKSISVGHILTTISMVVMAFAWTSNVEKRLAIHDTQIYELQEADRRQLKENELAKSEILGALHDINMKLDRYIERNMRMR